MKQAPSYVQLRNSRITSARDSVLGVISVKNKKSNVRSYIVFRTVKNSPLSTTAVDIGAKLPVGEKEWVVTEIKRVILTSELVSRTGDKIFITESDQDSIPFAKEDLESVFNQWNTGFTTIVAIAADEQVAMMSFKESGLINVFDEEVIGSVDDKGWVELKRARTVGIITNGSTANTAPKDNTVVAEVEKRSVTGAGSVKEGDESTARKFKDGAMKAAVPLGLAASMLLLTKKGADRGENESPRDAQQKKNNDIQIQNLDDDSKKREVNDLRRPLGSSNDGNVNVYELR